MLAKDQDLENTNRPIFCETHSKLCQFSDRTQKCPCCRKQNCLCDYILQWI